MLLLYFKACNNAKLYPSDALSSKKALELASLYQKDLTSDSDKEIREYSEIINHLFTTKEIERFVPVKARHTFFDQREQHTTRLVALSPSPAAVTQSISNLVKLKITTGSVRKRNIIPLKENLNAVALHFTFGEFSAVLGSDLEVSVNPHTGWRAVLSDKIITELSLIKSSVFKVPHHGSQNGHHQSVWDDMLIAKPLSVTTPYSPSNLPTPQDIARIKQLSSEFWITKDPQSNKKIKRDSMVEREYKSVVLKRKTINDRMGHIQIRSTLQGDISIATNNTSMKL